LAIIDATYNNNNNNNRLLKIACQFFQVSTIAMIQPQIPFSRTLWQKLLITLVSAKPWDLVFVVLGRQAASRLTTP
jgi:hypothetical protein